MVSPCGVRVSDFMIVARLVGNVILELKAVSSPTPDKCTLCLIVAMVQQSGEGNPKYQDVLLQLTTLERVLSRLYELRPGKHPLVHLDANQSRYERLPETFRWLLGKDRTVRWNFGNMGC